MDNSVVMIGDFSISLLIMDRTPRQKMNKEIGNMKNTINQLQLKQQIVSPFYPTTAEYMVF
jgi:hypothetical protein